ncbi:cbb3-type cytochrome c oxidase subunit 3 [Alteromonadaceae bacterium M269]|nr:cbb3-type cytochrome c oxidase subunit 3 [Alteromonadaceae bacterium M269]
MDSATSGTIYTLIVFISFIGVVLWAFSKRSKESFDEAANLVFDDEKQANLKQESSTNE